MSLINYFWCHRRNGIRRSDLVLDIGSGNNPFLRSDILVEKYVEDDSERYSGIVLDRPTVCADGASLPFRDKSVDFIYCSHVLEHVVEPRPFLEELSRVGKRGVIVTPHPGYDMIHPRRGHLWYIWTREGTLHLKQKTRWDEFPEIYEYFRGITRLPGYWRFWDRNFEQFNTTLEWQDSIPYRIEQVEEFEMSRFVKAGGQPDVSDKQDQKELSCISRVKSLAASAIRPFISRNTRINLDGLIRCPLCKGDLSTFAPRCVSLVCRCCAAEFPVTRGIPRLVREKKGPIPVS